MKTVNGSVDVDGSSQLPASSLTSQVGWLGLRVVVSSL